MKYEFSQETKIFTSFVDQMPPMKDLTIEALRQQNEKLYAKINGKLNRSFKGVEREQIINRDTIELPITIYTPVDTKYDNLIIFFHGGGGIMGSRKTHQSIVNMLADATKSVWISVEYRSAPEYKYPTFLDDCLDVTRHIISNKQEYGGNESTKIGLVGDSMGATIAASLSHSLKTQVHFQILMYGAFNFSLNTASVQEFQGVEFMTTPEMIEMVEENVFDNKTDLADPRVSVLLNKSFEQLPPTLFIIGEFDPLRDDSYEYQRVLAEAGVKTSLTLIRGVIHGFVGFPGIFQTACRETSDAIQDFIATLKESFSNI